MRIKALLLALLISHVTVVGQVVTFNYIKAPLETVLSDVTRQTGFSFHYQGQNLTDGTINFSNAKPVTLTVNGVEISTALKYVFDDQPHYKYSLEKEIRKVFISNKSETESTSNPFFTIRGRVSDEQGKPLDGATILV